MAKKWLEDKRWKTCRKFRPLEEVSHPSPRVQGAHGHHLEKGKKSPILKAVDRAAKNAGKAPTKPDRGFRQGKVAKIEDHRRGVFSYPAKGQEGIVHIYRSALLRKTDHKVYFDVFDAGAQVYAEKCIAYVSVDIVGELHRGHTYRVWFNADPKYPQIVEVFGELPTP